MPKYKVKRKCFYGGIYRVPGGPHDPVVTVAPIKNLTKNSSLELIEKVRVANSKPFSVGDAVAKINDFTDADELKLFVIKDKRSGVVAAVEAKLQQLTEAGEATGDDGTEPAADGETGNETTTGDTADFMGDQKKDDDSGLETL